ncbi:dyslexia-associated protein KIAA0319-like protein isoform X2 [Palaemon carinicauda]|uniref:dyslexia-associated protein KIAA0319-like protein isoform X2 n=1 Tax=Palaemon carinicauda TaxID=392227 RepID=UPI0035B672A3
MAKDKRCIITILHWASFLSLFHSSTCLVLNESLVKELEMRCPSLDGHVYENSVLLGARKAGKYDHMGNATDIESCTRLCCLSRNCHVAILHNNSCANLVCSSAKNCQIIPGSGTHVVKVRNVDTEDQEPVSETSGNGTAVVKSMITPNGIVENVLAVSSDPTDRRCEVGLKECNTNEICVPLGEKRRDGLCKCISGFHQSLVTGECIINDNVTTMFSKEHPTIASSSIESENNTLPSVTLVVSTAPPATDIVPPVPEIENTSPKPDKKLVVSVNNKTVYLTTGGQTYEKRVTLSAYAIGDSSEYKYKWILVKHPETDDSGYLSDANSQTITLSHLIQGVYIFKVNVTGPGAHGDAFGSVTVLPPKRINQPPKAVVIPASQEIKLPNSGVIVDGSSSTDDGEITSYRWEMVTAPLGYKLSEETAPALQLTDLVPGNYTIMLLVKDEEGLEGNTTTFLSVVKETDYRPTANAGGDQIVYLPQTEITLYGNASTDDHGIEEWEWIKGPKDSGKAVDMKDTRTPFLHLSNLEEGHYQFILRVTDGTGQLSEAPVSVYVQKPNMNIPKANAGEDMRIVLPNTTVILDGSQTTDVSANTHWLWKKLSGPSNVHFSKNDEVKVNVSGLTKGDYVFMLTTWNGDDPSKNSSNDVTVSVIQDKNVSPKANAGGDFSVTLPVSVIAVDGSQSSDDVSVTKWKWERDSTSLAAGMVINASDSSPVLMFTDVVAGVYVWKLTVWDDQGASSSDTVSIIVKDSIHHLDEVELLVRGDIGKLSYSQLSTLLQKLQLFLHTSDSAVDIHLICLTGLPYSGHVRLTFLAYAGKNIVRGPEVVTLLRHQINSESSELLDLPLISVDTVVCQNNCSGHGECIQSSRECRCQTWWMESFMRRHMGDGVQNCDWSVVYVFVTICFMAIALGLVIWGVIALIVRYFGGNTKPRRKPPRYSLLDNYEENTKLKTHMLNSLLDSGSESDSDAEVLFDSRKTKHKSDKQRNGYQKLTRIRT